jgi:branched-chain amino acid transport system substrate-binding protein
MRVTSTRRRDALKRAAILVFLPAVLLAAGCARRASDAIEVGVVIPLTGQYAPFGAFQARGYEMALEEINAAGGVLGKPLRLAMVDSVGKPELAMAAVEKLVRRRVPVIIGEYNSACTYATTVLARRHEIPLLCPTAAMEDITRRGNPWIFRLNAPSSDYAETMVRLAQEVAGARTFAIIHENTSFGIDVGRNLRRVVEAQGLEVVEYQEYEKGTPDFKPLLQRIKAQDPDALCMISYVLDAVLLMRQSHELNLNPRLYIGGGAGFTTPQFLQHAGPNAEYVFSVTQWTPDVQWPGAREYTREYRRRYQEEPEYHSAETYGALYVIRDALEQAGVPDRERIRQVLARMEGDGVFGPYRFENFDGYTQQNRHPMVMVQVQNGRYVTVYPPEWAAASARYPVPAWSQRAFADRGRGTGNGRRETGDRGSGTGDRGPSDTTPVSSPPSPVPEGPSAALQTLVDGLVTGGLYALIGIGLTLIFGVMRVVNFAHGQMMMVGMYLTWWLFERSRVPVDPYVSLLVVVPALFLLGAAVQRFLIQPLLSAPHESQILMTVGLSLVLANAAQLVFQADDRSVTTSYSNSVVSLGGLGISVPRLISFGLAAAFTVGLWLLLDRTDFGRAMRATAQNRSAAQLMGVPVRRVAMGALGIGAALAGAAGALLVGPAYYLNPSVGGPFTLKAFAVVVLGGLGNVFGAIFAGILLGLAEAFGALYLPAGLTGYKDAIGLIALLAILFLRPAGLFGRSVQH